MPEPVSIATSFFAGFNSVIKAISLTAHYKEVPKEVKQLHTNIERAESSIKIARRLQRSKIHYVDPRLIVETDESIDKTNSVLLLLRDSIEACRKDLQVKETVTAKNRVAWLLWKSQEFVSQLQTLGNCLDALDRDIVRLEMAHPPLVFVNGGRAPPAYADNGRKKDNDGQSPAGVEGEEGPRPPFPWSPTKRLRSTNNNSSQVNMNKRTDAGRESRTLSPQLQDGDEGYGSEESPSRPRSRDRTICASNSTQETVDDIAALFASSTIGVDIAGLGLSIPSGALNVRQVKFLQQVASTTASPIRVRQSTISELPAEQITSTTASSTWVDRSSISELPVQEIANTTALPIRVEQPTIAELPATQNDDLDQPTPVPVPYVFSSRNPWRKLVSQPSTATLGSIPAGNQKQMTTNFTDASTVSLTTTMAPTLVDDGEDIAHSSLRLSTTAPAISSASASTEALLSPEPERKKLKWRRKSDFI